MTQSLRTRLVFMAIVPAMLAAFIVGGYALSSRISDAKETAAQRQKMITDSFAARLESLPLQDSQMQSLLLHALLEEQDVRAAALSFDSQYPPQHAGPRMRPLAHTKPDHYSRLSSDKSWQLTRRIDPGVPATLTVEFSRQQEYVTLLEGFITLLFLLCVLIIVAMLPALRFSRQLTQPIAEMIEALQHLRDGRLNIVLKTQARGELKELEQALTETVQTLKDAQTELQHNVDQATQDLRETLETIEIQNIELDMARKEALQASQIKSEFLANMSHEIRTPLNGILGFTRLLKRSLLTPRQRDYLHTIHKSADSLLAIINDVLDFSKIEAGKLSLDHIPLNLHDLIEDVQTLLAPMAQEKSLEQAAIIYSDVPVNLLGDPLRIRQVLTNLMSNAIKFTDEGSVVVRAMVEEEAGIETTIKVTVTDTGKGLSDEEQKPLFQAFNQADNSAQREESGTGLGLAICKKLVEGMGGEIGIDSAPGKGSTFWFTLRAERDIKRQVSPQTLALKSRTVTLLETEENGRLGLYHMLSHWQMPIREYPSITHLQRAIYDATLVHSDFLIISLPNDESDTQLQPLVEQLADIGAPLILLCNNPEAISTWVDHLPHCQVLGKPATRQRLLNTLLGFDGETALETEALSEPAAHFDANVMVVDDHPGNLKLASVFLEEMSVTVTACSSGEEALAAFEEQHFDLIFMDIQMPGMDGKEATRQIRQKEMNRPRTPIIALTAHALESEKQALLQTGLDDYLSKPISETQLHHTLNRWLNSKSDTVAAAPPSEHAPSMPVEQDRALRHTNPTALTNDMPVYDGALARKRAGGRDTLAQDMHRMLLSNLKDDRPAISLALENQDTDMLLEHVHKLHGATRYCGTPRLEYAARALETALKQQEEYEVLVLLTESLCDEICTLVQYLDNHFSDNPETPGT